MLIRNVKKEDIPQMVAISEVAFPDMEIAHYTDLIHFIVEDLAKWCFVVEIDNKLVGYTSSRPWDKGLINDDFYKRSPIYSGKDYLGIISIEILPQHQSQGIGSKLINMLIEQARQQHFRALILSCREEKQGYYRRFGFELKGESLYDDAGVWYDMTLTLDES